MRNIPLYLSDGSQDEVDYWERVPSYSKYVPHLNKDSGEQLALILKPVSYTYMEVSYDPDDQKYRGD